MIPLLYEDDDLLAIDKPSGVSSIPERDPTIPSVVTLLEQQTGRKIFVVHRLDKEVDGIMLFAKNAAAHKFLSEAFFNRNVRKTYLTLVHGTVREERGSIEKAIRQFGSGRMGIDEVTGKPSRTDFSVLRSAGNHTLLNAFPLTGRRHQIRVHLYHLGHPIAGDLLYGDKKAQAEFPRLFLHAQRIAFKNPAGKDMELQSAMTAAFEKATEDFLAVPRP